MAKIIRRDFFPEVPKLQAQLAYMESADSNDPEKLKEISERFAAAANDTPAVGEREKKERERELERGRGECSISVVVYSLCSIHTQYIRDPSWRWYEKKHGIHPHRRRKGRTLITEET